LWLLVLLVLVLVLVLPSDIQKPKIELVHLCFLFFGFWAKIVWGED